MSRSSEDNGIQWASRIPASHATIAITSVRPRSSGVILLLFIMHQQRLPLSWRNTITGSGSGLLYDFRVGKPGAAKYLVK